MRVEEIEEALKHKTVGIAGCGGLGSNAASALARAGVGILIVADADKVELSNLNRQYYFVDQIGDFKAIALKENVRKANPSIVVHAHIVELTPAIVLDLFSRCDVVLEALDSADAKEMMIETLQHSFPHLPLVSGVGVAGWGKNDTIGTVRSGSLYVIGDRFTETTTEDPPLGPRVAVVAAMMANLALEIMLGKD